MFGKAMNRYYYGKAGQGDYNKDDLPTNRWQLFWEMLRIRFSGLFRLNLMYMIVWLPAIVVIGRFLSMCISGIDSLGTFQTQLDAGEITVEAFGENAALYLEAIKSLFFQTLLLLIPCIAITGPFTAGITYVTRNWARDEHAFIFSDFVDAMKANWKQALITSVITGVMPTVVYVCNMYYGGMAEGNLIFMVPQVLCILIGIIWSLMLVYIYPLIITYDLKYKDVLRNAVLLSIARLPYSVLFRLGTLVPSIIAALLCYFLTQYTFIILLVLAAWYLLLGFALSRFVDASYTNAVFDKYINVKIEGAQVNRGLYNEEDDDEDYEETQSVDMEE
ncbi:MAG: YesL family protein [Clostridia bacterium]|nr:YesL family protein [Clostridia bacterium]MBP3650663.1 YesL family protein [Clostridia bacterium]